MKKVGLLYREKIIEQLENKWNQAEGCIFINFHKVGAFPFNCLRNELKKENASILVSKISLLERALEKVGTKSHHDFFDRPTGLVFINSNDIVKVCKILVNFSKENEGFALKGGVLKEKPLNSQDLEELSKLPPREILMAQVVMTIAAPLTGFYSALNNIILKFLWVVDELKTKKTKPQ